MNLGPRVIIDPDPLYVSFPETPTGIFGRHSDFGIRLGLTSYKWQASLDSNGGA